MNKRQVNLSNSAFILKYKILLLLVIIINVAVFVFGQQY